jgi:hypothetical protein
MILNPSAKHVAVCAVLFAADALMSASLASAVERYEATLTPLNADKIGGAAAGIAKFEIVDGKLKTTIDLVGLPPSMAHLQHFHGFGDDRNATCATLAQDVNNDGYVDLIETEAVSGVTMLPFHAHPASLDIAANTYPIADSKGRAHYDHVDIVAELEAALHASFGTGGLKLAERVIIVHTIPSDMKLPEGARSLPGVPPQVTLPIACGKIKALD